MLCVLNILYCTLHYTRSATYILYTSYPPLSPPFTCATYSQNFYSREEFWSIYDKRRYDSLRVEVSVVLYCILYTLSTNPYTPTPIPSPYTHIHPSSPYTQIHPSMAESPSFPIYLTGLLVVSIMTMVVVVMVVVVVVVVVGMGRTL